MKQFKVNLNLKSKIAVAVILAAFILAASAFVVFRYGFTDNNATATIASSTAGEGDKVKGSKTEKETTEKRDAKETKKDEKPDDKAHNIELDKINMAEDESRLSFKESEYSAVLRSPISVELDIKDSSIAVTGIEWELSDKNAGKIKKDKDGARATVTLNKVGSFELSAVSNTGVYCVCEVSAFAPDEYEIKDVPFFTQNDSYPSGCESLSATMLLNYYKYDITPNVFIDSYLPKDYLRASDDGTMVVGPDPYTAFIGTPYDENSLGCYPPVIVEAFSRVFKETGTDNKAVDTTGKSLEELIDTYIVQDEPVLVWSTMYLWDAFETETWAVDGASDKSPYNDGDVYSWIANEHCLVLTGYDEYYYYFNDPLYYEGGTRYEKEAFNLRFEQVGKCSVAIKGGVLDKKITVNAPADD